MSLTINHQTNDISATSGSVTIDGAAPGVGAIRAWINFNGTGTIAIRDDGNFSSISDLGTGYYRTTFSNSMSSANYSVGQSAGYGTSSLNDSGCAAVQGDPSTSTLDVRSIDTNATSAFDYKYVNLQVTI